MKRFIAILILLLAPSAFATNWFVSQFGAGSETGTSSGNAATVGTFNTTLAYGAGDTVFFIGGTITSQIAPRISGSPASPITYDFTGAPLQPSELLTPHTVGGSNPVLWAGNIRNTTAIDNSIFTNITWLAGTPVLFSLQGTTGANETNECLWVADSYTTNIFFYNCTHYGVSNEMTTPFQLLTDCSGFTVSNNIMTNTAGFCQASFNCSNLNIINDVVVSNPNTNWQTDLIFFGGGSLYTIKGCYLENDSQNNQTSPFANGRHNDCIQIFKGGSGGAIAPYGIVIAYNWLEMHPAPGSDASSSFTQIQGLQDQNGLDAIQFYANVCATVEGAPSNNDTVDIFGNTGTATVRCYNNTSIAHPGDEGMFHFDNTDTTHLTNNVTECDTNPTTPSYVSFFSLDPGTPALTTFNGDYNFAYGFGDGGSGGWLGVHGGTKLPQFVNYLGGNYNLSSSSPLLGAGTPISAPFNVGLAPNATWPNPALLTRTGAFDVGAYVGAGSTVTNFVFVVTPTNASVTLAQNVNYNLQWQTNGVTDIAPQNGNNTLTVYGINIIGVDSGSTLVNGAYNRNQAATIAGSTNVYGVAVYNGLTLTSNIVPLSQTNAVIPPAGMVYYPGFYAPMFFSSFYYIGTNATGLFAAPGVSGSAAVPLDGSTESNFDYNMSFITTRSIPKTVIHLQQGVFLTDGDLKWNLRAGNTLDGKGTNLTVIQFYAHDITNGTIVNSRVIAANGGMHGGISVSNLTADCNYQFGVPNITLKGGTLLGSSNIWFNVAVKNPAGWNPSVEDFGLSIFADSIGAGEGNLMSGCSITNYTGTNQDISGFNFTGLQDSVMSNNVVWQQSTNRVFARNITGNNILVISNQSFNCTVVQYQDSTPGGTNIFIVGNYDTNFTQFFDVKSGLYSELIMSNNVGYLSRGIPTDNGTLVLIGSSPGVYACAVTNFTFIFNNFNSSSQVTNGVFDVHNSANINVFTNVLYATVPATLETNFPGCVNIVLTGNTNQVGATPWPP